MKDMETEGQEMNERRNYTPDTAVVDSGRILCPYCKGFMGRAYYSAHAGAVELRCSNDRCKEWMRLEL